jgi:hypothetical protein
VRPSRAPRPSPAARDAADASTTSTEPRAPPPQSTATLWRRFGRDAFRATAETIQDIFDVCVAKREPDAQIPVLHRGYWFCIDDADRSTLYTFFTSPSCLRSGSQALRASKAPYRPCRSADSQKQERVASSSDGPRVAVYTRREERLQKFEKTGERIAQ